MPYWSKSSPPAYIKAALSIWLQWLLQKINGALGKFSRPSTLAGHQRLNSARQKSSKHLCQNAVTPRGSRLRYAYSGSSSHCFSLS